MAFPTTSDMFRAACTDMFGNTTAMDLNSDSHKGALYNNSVTGTKDDTAAQSAYGGTTWTGNEVSDTTGWAATGRVLDNPTLTNPSSGVVRFDVDDEVGGACTTGLTGFYGWQVYDDTLTTPVADQGVCFNYFGGSNTVAAGATLTVAINASGLFEIAI